MGAQHLTFFPEFFQKEGFQPEIWHFWTNIFGQENLWQFFDSQKFTFATVPITITCPLVKTLQPVNWIKSKFSFESNWICYQPNHPSLVFTS